MAVGAECDTPPIDANVTPTGADVVPPNVCAYIDSLKFPPRSVLSTSRHNADVRSYAIRTVLPGYIGMSRPKENLFAALELGSFVDSKIVLLPIFVIFNSLPDAGAVMPVTRSRFTLVVSRIHVAVDKLVGFQSF